MLHSIEQSRNDRSSSGGVLSIFPLFLRVSQSSCNRPETTQGVFQEGCGLNYVMVTYCEGEKELKHIRTNCRNDYVNNIPLRILVICK